MESDHSVITIRYSSALRNTIKWPLYPEYLNLLPWFFQLRLLKLIFFFQNFVMIINVYFSGWIPMVSLMIYVISFSTGFGPIPWLMMGEIFPGRIRGPAASIATAFNWTCTFIVTKSFMDLQVQILWFDCRFYVL
jgi:hypothetical protein